MKSISAKVKVSHSKAPNSCSWDLQPVATSSLQGWTCPYPPSSPPWTAWELAGLERSFSKKREVPSKIPKPSGNLLEAARTLMNAAVSCFNASNLAAVQTLSSSFQMDRGKSLILLNRNHLVQSPDVIFLSHVFHKLKSFFFHQTHSGASIPGSCFQLTCEG